MLLNRKSRQNNQTSYIWTILASADPIFLSGKRLFSYLDGGLAQRKGLRFITSSRRFESHLHLQNLSEKLFSRSFDRCFFESDCLPRSHMDQRSYGKDSRMKRLSQDQDSSPQLLTVFFFYSCYPSLWVFSHLLAQP